MLFVRFHMVTITLVRPPHFCDFSHCCCWCSLLLLISLSLYLCLFSCCMMHQIQRIKNALNAQKNGQSQRFKYWNLYINNCKQRIADNRCKGCVVMAQGAVVCWIFSHWIQYWIINQHKRVYICILYLPSSYRFHSSLRCLALFTSFIFLLPCSLLLSTHSESYVCFMCNNWMDKNKMI